MISYSTLCIVDTLNMEDCRIYIYVYKKKLSSDHALANIWLIIKTLPTILANISQIKNILNYQEYHCGNWCRFLLWRISPRTKRENCTTKNIITQRHFKKLKIIKKLTTSIDSQKKIKRVLLPMTGQSLTKIKILQENTHHNSDTSTAIYVVKISNQCVDPSYYITIDSKEALEYTILDLK